MRSDLVWCALEGLLSNIPPNVEGFSVVPPEESVRNSMDMMEDIL